MRFSPATQRLDTIGDSAAITVTAAGIDPATDSVQVTILHTNAVAIVSPRCVGLFDGAFLSGPTRIEGGTSFGCAFIGRQTQEPAGDVVTFDLRRVAPGDPQLTFGTDPGAGTMFALVGQPAFPSAANVLTVTGLPGPEPTPKPEGPVNPQLPSDEKMRRAKQQMGTLDSTLWSLVSQIGTRPLAEIAAQADAYEGSSVYVRVLVSEQDSYEAVAAVRGFIEDRGGRVIDHGTRSVRAYLPVSELLALGHLDAAIQVNSLERITADGTVTSLGTSVIQSLTWNDNGFTGQGVKVGVIDKGFAGLSQLTGTELPPAIEIIRRCYTGPGAFTDSLANCETVTEHGTAVAETLLDIAPDVTLYIANPKDTGDLKATTQWMADNGVAVINYSQGHSYIWGPGDGTSPDPNSPYASVDLAVQNGVVWVKSAGNTAKRSWFGEWTEDQNQWLIFEAGDTFNKITLGALGSVQVSARWEDPNWDRSARDIDLFLYNDQSEIVASSTLNQLGQPGQWARELLTYTNSSGSDANFWIGLKRFSGAQPDWLNVTTDLHDLEYPEVATSLSPPADSANSGMLAVGASAWQHPGTINENSSQGPTTDNRIKPELVAPDCTETVTYDTVGTTDEQKMFCGTSASAPHVAGLAALVRQRWPWMSPATVAQYLKNQAHGLGSPSPNNVWGEGVSQLPDESLYEPLKIFGTVTNQGVGGFPGSIGHGFGTVTASASATSDVTVAKFVDALFKLPGLQDDTYSLMGCAAGYLCAQKTGVVVDITAPSRLLKNSPPKLTPLLRRRKAASEWSCGTNRVRAYLDTHSYRRRFQGLTLIVCRKVSLSAAC